MSQDLINRALGLAKQGLPDDGIGLLQPLLSDPPFKASALMIMAYCYETKGDLATAEYLYAKAIVLDSSRESWRTQLQKCKALHEKRVREVKAGKPSWRPFFLGLLLMVIAAVTAYAAVPGILSDLLDVLLGIETANLRTFLITVSLTIALLGMVMVFRFSAAMFPFSRKLTKTVGADYSAVSYAECKSCNLRYDKGNARCTFCGALRVTPQPQVATNPPCPPSEQPADVSVPSQLCPRCQMTIPRQAYLCPYCKKRLRTSPTTIAVLCAVGFIFLLVLLSPLKQTTEPDYSPLKQTTKPDYIKDVVAYKEGSHGIMVYFILADESGAMTASPGKVTITISETHRDYTKTVLYSTSWQVTQSDFTETKVGIGAFAHDAIICPIGLGRIPYSAFSRIPWESYGKVHISFQCPSGRTLEGEETIFF